MKDLPMFMTEHGAASLILREIPYQGIAYVIIRDSLNPHELIEDCAAICRAAGAEAVYASGHSYLEKFLFHTAIVKMMCPKKLLERSAAELCPVEKDTLGVWQGIYNDKISRVPNASWLTQKDAEQMLLDRSGYFVKYQDRTLGIGKVEGSVIRFVASMERGAGSDVVRALGQAVHGEIAELEVATTNKKAITLYEKLGFSKIQELSRWFKIV